MSLGNKVAADLPFLRRYARALAGSQELGDAQVRALLEAAVADAGLRASLDGGRVALYRAFNLQWSSSSASVADEAEGLHEAAAQAQLRKITPLSRQALLLTTLEDFSPDQAADILGLAVTDVEDLVREAIAEIARETAAAVLIIEDEPLISMQLEELVRSLGHDIAGTAATRSQAQTVAADTMPGLVLADIQLADGSSGLDAVDDILALGEVPVIFITAYPERLLTGCCREPTYLITKPFTEASVRAAIGQALFFGSSRPVE
ncbi:two-component response regulator [Erythrobacter sp. SG61-1L]|uniref:response regulator n=1 Tax=Erythrobacter sp. SG61-1L TaxID=1603897 RepID=UPI0006C936EE|nr:response regulator [Erythrobacter sp. SG61-1L]KPL68701.1 two-component response regulator [Erythrobacter sp. SG61-1L]